MALGSFTAAFLIARTFTTFFPSKVLVTSGIHIHHFWFGLALIAFGGWIGICYNHAETDRLAAIIYGIGGGLVIDEVGLLLTFGDYWTSLTYTFMIIFLAFIAALYLFYNYRQTIIRELEDFFTRKISLYFAVFLAAVSIAFVAETNNFLVILVSIGLTVIAIVTILLYLTERIRRVKK